MKPVKNIILFVISIGLFLLPRIGFSFFGDFFIPEIKKEDIGNTAIVVIDNFAIFDKEGQDLTIANSFLPHGIFTINQIITALEDSGVGYEVLDFQGNVYAKSGDSAVKIFIMGVPATKSGDKVQLDLSNLAQLWLQISTFLTTQGFNGTVFKNVIINNSFGGPEPVNEGQRQYYRTLEEAIARLEQYDEQNGTNILIVAPTARGSSSVNYPGVFAEKYSNVIGVGTDRHGYWPSATDVHARNELAKSVINLQAINDSIYAQFLMGYLIQYREKFPDFQLQPLYQAVGNSFLTAYISGIIAGKLAGYSPDETKMILSNSTDEEGYFNPEKIETAAAQISIPTSPQFSYESIFRGFIW